MNIKLILLGLIFIFLISCDGSKYDKELKEVKEMQQVLDGVKLTYANVDISKADNAFSTYEKNMNQISTYYHPDSIPMDVYGLIDFYKGVKKNNKSVQREYKLIGEHIGVVDEQLRNLASDLKGGLIHEDSIVNFLENEHNNLQIVQDNVGTLVYSYEYMIAIHDSVAVQMQNILLNNVK